jgi:hypothetical protein
MITKQTAHLFTGEPVVPVIAKAGEWNRPVTCAPWRFNFAKPSLGKNSPEQMRRDPEL